MTHPYRQFVDVDGIQWEVWEAQPALTERRQLPDRRGIVRQGAARRQVDLVSLPNTKATGWLVFRSPDKRYRCIPVPDGWEALDDAGLVFLLEQAIELATPKRHA